MSNCKLLYKRTIVITGSARGLGRSIARRCLEWGANVIIADILTDKGQVTADQLAKDWPDQTVSFMEIDLSEPKSIEEFAEKLKSSTNQIDGLINNAAIATNVGGKSLEDIDIELWDRVMAVNVRGTWLVTRALTGLMSNHDSMIVNMASDTAFWGPEKLLAYVTSKGAVVSMTKAMARELGERGIGVIGIAPGIMKCGATEYVPAARHKRNEENRAIKGAQNLDEITEIIAFAVSPAARAMTGQILITDAGFHLN